MVHKLNSTRRFAKVIAVVTAIGTVALATATLPAQAAHGVPRTPASVPETPFVVKVVDPDCQRPGEPVETTYTSVDESVKDTIPGEWWPASAYSTPMVNGGLKSGAIIIRSRILYQDTRPLYPTAAYATANVDWPASQQLPISCGEWQMNTILPKSTNSYQGGSYWGNAIGYESNLAVDRTTSMVIVRDTGSVIVAEWNQAVEDRSVACNYTSRDWAYCAVNALAEFQNSPWGQNRLARRLNTSPSNRVEFQAEAYNERVSRYHPYGYSTWSWSNSASDGTGSDGSTWTGTHYMKADPNNGAGFAGNENYQGYSPVIAYKVAFPQSGIFYVCVRGMGGSPSDDSLHAGIDDNNDGIADASTALDMTGNWQLNSWQWSNRRIGGYYATMQVSGDPFHTLKIWMREDGMRVDKIILSTSANCPT